MGGNAYPNICSNIVSLNNTVAFPDKAQGMGGPVTQSFRYDGLYRLTHAQGIFQDQPGSNDQYTLDMAYDPIHNILSKNQVHTLTHGQPKKDQAGTFDFAYQYNSGHPHAPTHIGDRTFTYDADGNQTGFTSDTNGQKRSITWDEENRIQAIADQGSTSQYKYDESGQRAVKLHQQGETAYVNQFYIVRNGALFTKEVFAGTARVAAKLEPGKGRNTPLTAASLVDLTVPQPTVSNGAATILNDPTNIDLLSKAETKVRGHREELDPSNFPGQGDAHRSARADQVAQNNAKNPNLNGGTPGGGGGGTGGGGSGGSGGGGGPTGAGPGLFLYYYHPDHLGSTQFVSTQDGSLSEHIEYIPFGETWVDEGSTKVQSFLFTSKELDTETGLYYFGARYYDPRTSVWQSADPIIEKYLPEIGENSKRLVNGGVYKSMHLSVFAYAGYNPLFITDPDGKAEYYSVTGIFLRNDNDPTNNTVIAVGTMAAGHASNSIDLKITPEAFHKAVATTYGEMSSKADKTGAAAVASVIINRAKNPAYNGGNQSLSKAIEHVLRPVGPEKDQGKSTQFAAIGEARFNDYLGLEGGTGLLQVSGPGGQADTARAGVIGASLGSDPTSGATSFRTTGSATPSGTRDAQDIQGNTFYHETRFDPKKAP